MLPDSISDKELADMFFENDEDISFDGLIVDGIHSVDGLPHKINNFDDFKKYIEPEDMERSRYNPIPDNRQIYWRRSDWKDEVLNMDKAEVEEALQELNSIYNRTKGVELPALDKLFDNIDSNGVDK